VNSEFNLVFNKRIYLICGFDPRGARFYHRLFREESKKVKQTLAQVPQQQSAT